LLLSALFIPKVDPCRLLGVPRPEVLQLLSPLVRREVRELSDWDAGVCEGLLSIQVDRDNVFGLIRDNLLKTLYGVSIKL
jgi:hypothetical protein